MTSGVVLALCSALVWGSGDYCGGRAARRLDPFQVLALAAVSGISLLAVAALMAGESRPGLDSIMWSAAAGVAGACGIVALYRGLAVGNAATVAPLAAVVAAILPVLFTIALEGRPQAVQLGGFVLALAGIGLVARATPTGGDSQIGARLGVLAGVGFGGFLILIAQVEAASVYLPLAVARFVMLLTAIATLTARRMPFPAPFGTPIGLLAGVLDAGGNILYLLARQQVRLDVAAVLSSLYPVSTVVLARVVSREPVTRLQWFGAAVCLLAVVLITA
jgi:drug/metabolite transporter (DMT)-like permease